MTMIPEWLRIVLDEKARRERYPPNNRMEPPMGVDRAMNMVRPAWMLEGEPKQHFSSPEFTESMAGVVGHSNREAKYGPSRSAPPNENIPQQVLTGLGLWKDLINIHHLQPAIDNWHEGKNNIKSYLLEAMRRGNGR